MTGKMKKPAVEPAIEPREIKDSSPEAINLLHAWVAIAAFERKAERFLQYIGCVPATE